MPKKEQLLQTGKLPSEILNGLLSTITYDDERIIIGPRIGEDAAVIDYGDRVLVTKTDPITFATKQIGWYSVNINANDIVSTGAIPKWFMATILLPNNSQEKIVRNIFFDIQKACKDLNISLVGGHTEITTAVTHPIVVGSMIGETSKKLYLPTSGVKNKDDIILTKQLAIEGTTVIAHEGESKLKKANIPASCISNSKKYLSSPGISVVKEAMIARNTQGIHAMHDPTEGGLATAIKEICVAGNVGANLSFDSIPILPECMTLCSTFGLDPLGLLASGSLLICIDNKYSLQLISKLQQAGISACKIGEITNQANQITITKNKIKENLANFERDEIAKFFDS